MLQGVILEYQCDICGDEADSKVKIIGVEKLPQDWVRVKEDGKPMYMSDKHYCLKCGDKN